MISFESHKGSRKEYYYSHFADEETRFLRLWLTKDLNPGSQAPPTLPNERLSTITLMLLSGS